MQLHSTKLLQFLDGFILMLILSGLYQNMLLIIWGVISQKASLMNIKDVDLTNITIMKSLKKEKIGAFRQNLSVLFYKSKIKHGVDSGVRLRLADYLCEFYLFLVPQFWQFTPLWSNPLWKLWPRS